LGGKSGGVWSDATKRKILIETYPSATKRSRFVDFVHTLVRESEIGQLSDDEFDAICCAYTAWLFDKQRHVLVEPGMSVPSDEGWIWVTMDLIETRKEYMQ
jgi:hypothetical protein